MSDVIASLKPRPARRYVAVGIQGVLGGLLVLLGLGMVARAPGWGLSLAAIGAAVLVGTVRMYRATADHIDLTRTELRDSAGRRLAAIEDIVKIDRGVFAFKPANGFLIHLEQAEPRIWVPGLWWRLGRFVGVGGVTSASEAKQLLACLDVLLVERDAAAERHPAGKES